MTYTLDRAELIGAQIETVVYGIYLVLFPITLYITTRGAKLQSGRKVNGILVAGGCILFLFVTAHWILDQSRLWEAFVVHQGEPEGALLFYALLRETRNVVRIVFFVGEMIVLDSLLLYRLYVIWGHNWYVTILPAMTEIGTIVTGVALCVGFAEAPAYKDLWTLTLAKWITACFTLSLSTNILAVIFIAYRISSRDRALSKYGAGSLSSIITITVESAGIYCLVNTATMITLLSRTTVHFTILAVASPVTGISFSLITLRVGLGKTFSRFIEAHSTNSGGGNKNGGVSTIPMHVRITREQDYAVSDIGPVYDNYNETKGRSDDSGQSILPVMRKGDDAAASWA